MSWEGEVVSIHVASRPGEATHPILEARAVAGRGLEGDRNFGPAAPAPRPLGGEVTLIEVEAIEALARDHGLEIAPGAARRNIVTRGVPLNHLVGRDFQVGDAVIRGLELCEPCSYLAGLTDQRVLPGLVHRGGLRAAILRSGTIRPGDPVRDTVNASALEPAWESFPEPPAEAVPAPPPPASTRR